MKDAPSQHMCCTLMICCTVYLKQHCLKRIKDFIDRQIDRQINTDRERQRKRQKERGGRAYTHSQRFQHRVKSVLTPTMKSEVEERGRGKRHRNAQMCRPTYFKFYFSDRKRNALLPNFYLSIIRSQFAEGYKECFFTSVVNFVSDLSLRFAATHPPLIFDQLLSFIPYFQFYILHLSMRSSPA